MNPLRRGPIPRIEITRVRHRLDCGEQLKDIAQDLGRRPEVLQRHLDRYQPEVHPRVPNSSIKVTTAGGAVVEGLTLLELIRLARAL